MRRLVVLAVVTILGACVPQQPAAVHQIACPETTPIIIYKFVPSHSKNQTASSRTMAKINGAAKASRSLLKNPPNKKGP